MRASTLAEVFTTPTNVVSFSGGIGSWAAAMRVAESEGTEGLVLLFTDTRIEDPGLYTFLIEGAAAVMGERPDQGLLEQAAAIPGVECAGEDQEGRLAALERLQASVVEAMPYLAWIADGRTPWQVFRDRRFLGNSQVDPCSRILKRELAKAWMDEHCDPKLTTLWLGIDWTEMHRMEGVRGWWEPWRIDSPLCQEPYLAKPEMLAMLEDHGIAVPRLYRIGMPHNNCSGFYIKAGQAHYRLLLESLPEVYRYHEREEAALREHLGKDVAIMRRRLRAKDEDGQGTTLIEPLTLRGFREIIEQQGDLFGPERHEWGGCGCFVDVGETEGETDGFRE